MEPNTDNAVAVANGNANEDNSNNDTNNSLWSRFNRMLNGLSKDPMSTLPTIRCRYPGCGILLETIGWICICCHTFCDMHAPAFVRNSLGPNHRRWCLLCQLELLPSQVNRFNIEINRALSKFSQIGRTVNEIFDMLEFSLDYSTKRDAEYDLIRAKLHELEEADDRALAEAQAELEAAQAELNELQEQSSAVRHTCEGLKSKLSSARQNLSKMMKKMSQYCQACKLMESKLAKYNNEHSSIQRQVADRENENRRMTAQLASADSRLRDFREGNVEVEPPLFGYRGPASSIGDASSVAAGASGVDQMSIIEPSASFLGLSDNGFDSR